MLLFYGAITIKLTATSPAPDKIRFHVGVTIKQAWIASWCEMPFQLSLLLVLLFCICKINSTEQCETYLYKLPMTTFNIKSGSSQIFGFNDAKVLYSVSDSRLGEINFNITVNGTLCIGEYIFAINTFYYIYYTHYTKICYLYRNMQQ